MIIDPCIFDFQSHQLKIYGFLVPKFSFFFFCQNTIKAQAGCLGLHLDQVGGGWMVGLEYLLDGYDCLNSLSIAKAKR